LALLGLTEERKENMNPSFKDYSEKHQAILMQLESRFLSELSECRELDLFSTNLMGGANYTSGKFANTEGIYLLVRFNWGNKLHEYLIITLIPPDEKGEVEFKITARIDSTYSFVEAPTLKLALKKFFDLIKNEDPIDSPEYLFLLSWVSFYNLKVESVDPLEDRLWKELEMIPYNWPTVFDTLLSTLKRKNDIIGQHRLWFLMIMIKHQIMRNLYRIEAIEELVLSKNCIEHITDALKGLDNV
jgi:hypothetical protein